MSKKRKLSESSESESAEEVQKDASSSDDDEEEGIQLKKGEDIQTYVDAFYEEAPQKNVEVKEWIQKELWKSATFFIHLEDVRDSQTEEDIVHGAVPGSALTLNQYKILYALQTKNLDGIWYWDVDNGGGSGHLQPLREQVATWFFNPKGYGLKNLQKHWPQLRNITWREDGSVGSLYQYKKAPLSVIHSAIPIHIVISD